MTDKTKRTVLIAVTNDVSYDQRMQKTARTLTEFGFNLCIIGRKKKNQNYTSVEPYNIHRFNMMFQKGKLFYIEYQIRLFYYLITHNFDIVCAVDLDTILPCLLAAKIKQKKIVYDAHEYYTEVPELVDRPFEKRIWKYIEKICIPKCDKMYTVSKPIAELFSKEYSLSCNVIYNFPYTSQSTATHKCKPSKILYQGDLNMGRGLKEAIIAMNEVDAILYIAGDGYYRKQLEEEVKKRQLNQKVIFLGYLAPDSLKEITQSATIGLNLLENKGLNYYYSLANKFFDYVQQEIPSINMNFPCYREFNLEFECSILLDTLDPKSITMAINDLLHHEETYHLLLSNCKKAKEVWNWETQIPLLKNIYEF